MISYLILNKSGTILYQSETCGEIADHSDNGRIRYLPLLLIKDLIKVNLQNPIQHVRSGGKLVTFWERHNLLFIASTKQDRIPLAVLHKHLLIIDNYLRFSFGPQWQLRLHHDTTPRSRRSLHPPLTTSHLASCLAQLPFVSTTFSFCRTLHCLCLVEQVDLQEELNSRLTETLRDCCNNSFPASPSTTKSSSSSSSLSSTSSTSLSATNSISTSGNKLSSFFAAATHSRQTSSPSPPPPLFYNLHHRHHHNNAPGHEHQSLSENDTTCPGNWNHALLFAREKIVVHCSNKDHQQQVNPISDDVLFYLKLMVAEYIYENREEESVDQGSHSKEQQDATAPQSIGQSSATDDDTISPTTSSPTLCTSSANDSPNQTSPSFSYVYDANSTPPFKIYTKSTITQVSPSTAAIPSVSWSNPPPLIHSHLLSRLPKGHYDHGMITRLNTPTDMTSRDMDDELLQEMTAAMKVSSLTPSLDHHYHQEQYDDDSPLPPNAKAFYQQRQYQQNHHITNVPSLSPASATMIPIATRSSTSNDNNNNNNKDPGFYLSSSVPSSAEAKISTVVTNNSNNNHLRYHSEDGYTNNDSSHILRRGSTNSSPLGRSRRQSLVSRYQHHGGKATSHSDYSDDGNQDGHQQQHQQQMYHHLQQRHKQQRQRQRQGRQRGTAKTVRRWLKHGNRVILTRICLMLASDDLVVVLLFPDEMLSPSILTSLSSTKSIQYQQHQQHQQYQIKQFISSIRQHLQDFASFLLTKESVHFTILSFALTYPGLVHFIHIKKGVISSPQIVDLNEMDKHHEILHEIFGTYDIKPQTSIDTVIGKWRWPSVGRLKKLCDTMLYIGLSHSRQQSSPPSIQLLQESTSQHQGFHYLYLSDQQLRQQHDSVDVDPSDELLAVYFSFVPRNRILAMHQQLLSDVSQRHFLK